METPDMEIEKTTTDWAGIEADYRAGVKSIREIGRWYGVDPVGIRRKAKRGKWVRKAGFLAVERDPAILAVEPIDPADVSERARHLAGRMVGELDAVTAHHGELEDMICAEEGDPRRRASLLKAISLGERAMTLKNLSLTLKTLSDAGDVQGKKAQRQANAEESASNGRFAAPSAPKLVVSN